MIGKIVPPLLAVFDGIIGASKRSAKAMEYPKPRVFFPNRATRKKAIRLPSPVFSKPEANIKATKMSHTVLSENPDNPHERTSDEVITLSAVDGGPTLKIQAITTPKSPI